MAREFETIELSAGQKLITHKAQDAYRVMSGTVLVYIVPWEHEKAGRRSFLLEAAAGVTVPGFSYRDANYRDWRFCLVAVESAVLQCMPGMATSPLRRKLIKRAGITGVEAQSFDDSLVNHYRMSLVREDGFFVRTSREAAKTGHKTDQLLASAFEGQQQEASEDGTELYNVMAFACKRQRIPIADFARIKATYGADPEVEDIARASHMPYRKVALSGNWHRQDAGALIVFDDSTGQPAACVPRGQHAYTVKRCGEQQQKLTRQMAEAFSNEAYMLYRPLPREGVDAKGLVKFCLGGLSRSDMMVILILTVVSSLIGLLIPTLNRILYDEFIPMGNMGFITQLGVLILAFMIGNVAFSVVRSLCSLRLSSRIKAQVQNAVYHRVFELPESFIRSYESADLAKRIMELGELASQVTTLVVSVGMSAVMALFYLWQMFSYSTKLAAVSLLLIIMFCAVVYVFARYQMRYESEVLRIDGKSDSTMYQFLEGIEKVRMAGIENRAIYEYMKRFVEQRGLEIKIGKLDYIGDAIIAASGSISSVVLYILVYNSEAMSVGVFVAFTTAFGMLASAANGLIDGIVSYKMLQPAYARVKDVLETPTEANGGSSLPEHITGCIDVDHLSFAYDEDGPLVLDDISLHISAGESVGLVGMSGCGKSTLMKLLLGFERPTSGKIYYDNQDLEDLDLQELRRNFGVVLQDGELISGSIYENIELASPGIGLSAVNEMVAAVGLKDDIDQMPMGLFTMVSEGIGTLSGGQKQRIMIARALISRPKAVFFDEATSALDNITQKMVGETLNKLESTKILVAHRLSTIRDCDRIIVLEKGRIVQEGSYDQLLQEEGIFAQLAQRQLI